VDAEQTWHIIQQQRLAIADLLDRLTAPQWLAVLGETAPARDATDGHRRGLVGRLGT
jgi:hypothetical protein